MQASIILTIFVKNFFDRRRRHCHSWNFKDKTSHFCSDVITDRVSGKGNKSMAVPVRLSVRLSIFFTQTIEPLDLWPRFLVRLWVVIIIARWGLKIKVTGQGQMIRVRVRLTRMASAWLRSSMEGSFSSWWLYTRRLPSDVRTATPAFHVRSSALVCSRPGGLELVTRLPAISVTFRWQFSPGPENFSFLVLLAYIAHERLCDYALYLILTLTFRDVKVSRPHFWYWCRSHEVLVSVSREVSCRGGWILNPNQVI